MTASSTVKGMREVWSREEGPNHSKCGQQTGDEGRRAGGEQQVAGPDHSGACREQRDGLQWCQVTGKHAIKMVQERKICRDLENKADEVQCKVGGRVVVSPEV
eukprot:CAMPEP_0177678894 /NCGR_PEP_ID=MMETSP0447-20121125/29269_1 /TAXON_ID=0 /ORGANISM="Stygamoeba regulata, Strain BSH-02190019" /LENGTH=102 /DNA_ID=CAMNT_0019187961 /DNA_START=74 /DNA_END=381 /DNA_ORIENTATION=-